MKRAAVVIALLVLLGGAIAYFVGAQHSASPQKPAGGENVVAAAPPTAAPVTVAEVRRRESRDLVTLTGTLQADQQATITARFPSRISDVLVRDGDAVRRGQALVRLDVRDAQAQVAGAQAAIQAAEAQYRKAVEGKQARAVEMDAQVSQAEGGLRQALAKQRQAQLGVKVSETEAQSDADRAEGAVRQAEAGLRSAEAGLKQANDAVTRLQFLYDHGGIAKADLESAQSQAAIAKAQRDTAQAALDQAKAAAGPAVEAAPLRKQVSQADVLAAMAGVEQARQGLKNAQKARDSAMKIADQDIAAARAQVAQARAGKQQAAITAGGGALTSPFDGIATDVMARAGEMAQPGQPLMTVVATGSVHLEVAAPARLADRVKVGQSARVTLDTMPDRTFDGEVTDVLPVAGAEGRTLPVRVRFDTRGLRLTPGIGATADVELATVPNALTIPVDAVRSEGNVPFVYTVENGKAVRHNVSLGATTGNYVRVVAGLREGDQVILSGPATLQTGMPVQVVGR